MKEFEIVKQANGKHVQFNLFCDRGEGYWERTRNLTNEQAKDIESRIIDIFQEYGMGFGENSLDYEFHWHPSQE